MITITQATENDLQTILNLQYLAYQSEARLLDNFNIPPLKQTLAEVIAEFQKGKILKAVNEDSHIVGSVRGYCEDQTIYIGKLLVDPSCQHQGIGTNLLTAMEKEYPGCRYELFTSTQSKKNIQLYERLGYHIFQEKAISPALSFVYLEK